MSTPPKSAATAAISTTSLLDDLSQLTKLRLTALVLATTLVGFLMAAKDGVNLVLLAHTFIGTALVAAGAAALNQSMEVEPDSKMRRTEGRPLPAGRMSLPVAIWLGTASSTLGLVQLGIFVNGSAAALAALTLFTYAAVYTPLKQISSTCTLVGAVSGALPPLIGWAAAGGEMNAAALVLFGILFFWQLPHFISLNWVYREEYENAGFVMWCNGDVKGDLTAKLSLGFSVALLAVSLLAQPAQLAGMIYTLGAALLGLVMVWLAWDFLRRRTVRSARILFFWSIIYLPLMLMLLVFDK
jgi:protoheme IX farnesyltransferase